MGIMSIIENIVREFGGDDIFRMLQLYELTYPPDLALELEDDNPSFMDLKISGGDIDIAGFWYQSTRSEIAGLAVQDLISRLLIPRGQSRLAPDYGNGPIELIPREAIPGVVMLAGAESPYVGVIRSVTMSAGNVDDILIMIDGETVTGESFALPFTLEE